MKRSNPEGRVQLQILQYCKMKCWTAGKIKSKGSFYKDRFILDKYQFVGISDLLVFTPRIYFVEVKAPGRIAAQTYEQKCFEGLCIQANVPYILVDSLASFIERVK